MKHAPTQASRLAAAVDFHSREDPQKFQASDGRSDTTMLTRIAAWRSGFLGWGGGVGGGYRADGTDAGNSHRHIGHLVVCRDFEERGLRFASLETAERKIFFAETRVVAYRFQVQAQLFGVPEFGVDDQVAVVALFTGGDRSSFAIMAYGHSVDGFLAQVFLLNRGQRGSACCRSSWAGVQVVGVYTPNSRPASETARGFGT